MAGSDLPIGTVRLPDGGRIGISPLPGISGALQADVAKIADWGASAVVSMTETDEMARLGCADLGAACRAAGMAWHHLPVRDFGGPEGESAAGWPLLSHDLHQVLDQGGAILLHCRGGKGRSGMIALRLMVEHGANLDAALARIREARPGAVETQAQFEWAASGSVRVSPGR
jgi:protein-tyrosine phosphatase